jgi:dolichyl-diphosphooligosaccharide--protein glycosyltransferase
VAGNDSGEQEEMRYVMIDRDMASGKFGAITQWTGPDYGHYYGNEQFTVGNQTQPLPSANENYDNTMMSSLYLQDAAGMEHYRLVHESDDYSIVGSMAVQGQVRPHHSLGLRDTGWTNQTAAIASGLTQARNNNEVYQDLGTPMWDAHVVSSVKTFERVDGATITGTVAGAEAIDTANATAVVAVPLETDTGRTFAYRQRANVTEDGTFEVTVPYATTDELGVEDGYTDSSVEAIDNYTATVFTTSGGEPTYYSGQTDVPEPAVVNGESVDVSLEQVESPPDNVTDGNETAGNETGGNETDGSTDSGGSNSSDDGSTGSGTANAIAPIAVEPAR